MSETWREVSGWDEKAVKDRIRKVQLAVLESHAERNPVHSIIIPALNPSEIDSNHGLTMFRPVTVKDFPVGTWFYWGEDKVFVRQVGGLL